MVALFPFRALRPSAAHAARVASPPYDVVTTEEARALARGNADSFLRVSRPEVDLPQEIDEHTDAVHAKARDNLAELVRRGVLVQDPEPRFYVYAQRTGEHRQTGLAACATLHEYDTGVIRKHEKTSDEKVDDRFRHIDALSAHDEPLFLTYRGVPAIDRLIEEVKRSPPTYDLLTHRLWAVPRDAGAAIAALFRSVPALYIVARASDEDAEKKLKLAGADRVVLPYATAGRVMANLVLKPQVTAFLDAVTTAAGPDLHLAEIEVPPTSAHAGHTIRDIRVRHETGAIVVALRKKDGTFDTTPEPDAVIEAGDVLVSVGTSDELRRLEDLFGPHEAVAG